MKKKNFILEIKTIESNHIDGCIDRDDTERMQFYDVDELMKYINQYVNTTIRCFNVWYTKIEIKPLYLESKMIFTVDDGDIEMTKIFKWKERL